MTTTTEERLAYIRAEVERDKDDSEEGMERELADNLTGDGVQEQEGNSETVSEEPGWTLDIEGMMSSKDRNNWIYQINYDKPAESSTSVGGAVKNWFKQKIRRFIAPVAAPLVLDQNTFNASVTTSINVLSDNECKIADFMRAQDEQNRLLREEMAELKQEVARLRKENTAARMEIIRSRKRLHREVALLLEEIESRKEGRLPE